MKKLFYLLLVISVGILALLNSCSQNETDDLTLDNEIEKLSKKSNLQVSDFSNKFAGSWDIECVGTCDCALEFHLSNNTYNCTCNPCAMKIEFINDKNKINNIGTKEEQKKLLNYFLYEYDFSKEFKKYLEKNETNKIIKIKSITNKINEKYRFSLIQFKNSKGEDDSIAFYQNINSRKAFTVDCTGSCNCLEQFNPATGVVSCSCSPCSMKVTEIP